MKRFRLSTLMLVVVIVALVIALFRERRRSESALAELKIGQARAQTTMTFYFDQVARTQTAMRAEQAALASKHEQMVVQAEAAMRAAAAKAGASEMKPTVPPSR
jgi:hypothetical protein